MTIPSVECATYVSATLSQRRKMTHDVSKTPSDGGRGAASGPGSSSAPPSKQPLLSGIAPSPAGGAFENRDFGATNFREMHQSLAGARFTKAKLVDCDFDGLDLADLTGAELGSSQKNLDERLELAKSLADNLRSLFIAACGLFTYIAATIMSANDALVLTNTTTLELPIIDAKVSVHAFFHLAGVLILALSTYILARVSHFARVVSKLPGRLPKGLSLREQVDPWVLSCVGILQRGTPGNVDGWSRIRPVFELFGATIPGLIVRWLGPAVLWYLSLRFFFACQPRLGAWRANLGFALLVLSFLGSWTVAYGLRSLSEFVDGVTPPSRASKYGVAAGVALFAVVAFRVLVQLMGLSGAPGEDLSAARLAGANLSGWNFAGSKLDGANLGNAKLSNGRFQEASLSHADLRRAVLDGASFVSARMGGANLALSRGSQANFIAASLEGSDFRRARLPAVLLLSAEASGAKMAGLVAPFAIGASADFSDCVFDDADLSYAMLNGARFEPKKQTTFFERSLLTPI